MADDPNPTLDVREVYRETLLVEIIYTEKPGERKADYLGVLSDFLVQQDEPIVFDIAAGARERLTPDE